MSDDELRAFIDLCHAMERSVKFNKARRTWTDARKAALAEQERRSRATP